MATEDDLPGAPPHVASEFYLWLWFRSDTGGGKIDFPDDTGGGVEFWVDDRLAFRAVGEDRVSAVLTGDNPGTSPEARAAVAGGKVLRDIKLALRRGDREYQVVLRGPRLEVSAAKLPGLLKGGDEAELLYERAFLYEELHFILAGLFRTFAGVRCSPAWQSHVLPDLCRWAGTVPQP